MCGSVLWMGESGPCLAVLADSHSREVLEDCRSRGSSAAGEIERRVLPARPDLVSLVETRRHQPPGFWVGALHHSDDLPPQPPRDGAWWRVAKAPFASQEVAPKQLLL